MNVAKSTSTDLAKDRSVMTKLMLSGIMILAGTFIYISSRKSVLFFGWIPSAVFEALRPFEIRGTSLPEYFVVYSLPDGLWYGALLSAQSAFLKNTFWSRCIFGFSILLPFVWEALQLCDGIAGTFDLMDLFAYTLALSIFLICLNNHQNYHEQK